MPSANTGRRGAPSLEDNHGRAALFMVAAAVTLPAINACAKHLSDYSVLQVGWARYAGHFAFMVLAFAPTNGLSMLRSSALSLQLVRSGLHCASALLMFSALGMVALTTATAINFSAPLIVTALAPLILGERIGLHRAIAVAVGFVGALIVVRPGYTDAAFATALLLANAFVSAAIQILSRKLAGRDRAITSNTYMVVVGFALLSLPLPFVWRMPATSLDLLVFLTIGIFGGLGHYFLVSAFEQAPASFVSPFNYLQIIGAAALGYLVFGQLPDAWTWLGAAIIAASGMYVLLRERRARAKP
ncbi:DMT family transporter [Enterovirga aerilata]|uniref:DMT family transporter n=1 Tax=Enterovirga aerilata TaxID=2730920 RepID=A0A849I4H8_9HYPH|nr:DMT family transporter [Enterovirga sp. DB1703]NNM74736.1 DMT family transporter [Enterovirga sp. DB1703]